MTWTKLGDEAAEEMASLSDTAFRTHVEALIYSNRRLLDLVISKRDLVRLAETHDDPDRAAAELVDAGWWQELPEGRWYIGCRFADWQLERSVVERRKEQNALRQRRHRRCKAGDHSLCDHRDDAVTRDKTRDATRDETRDPGRVGSGRDGSGREDQERARESAHAPADASSSPGESPGDVPRDETRDPLSAATNDRCRECGQISRMSLLGGRCRRCSFAGGADRSAS